MWIEEENGWIKEEKGKMVIERGFPLFKMLSVYFSFASYSFYKPKIALNSRDLTLNFLLSLTSMMMILRLARDSC